MKHSIRYYLSLANPVSSMAEKFRHTARCAAKFHKNTRISKCSLEGDNMIGRNTKLIRTRLGRGTYISPDCEFFETKIGRYCSIGAHVQTCIGRHPYEIFASTHPAFYLNTRSRLGFTFHEGTEPLFAEARYPEQGYQVVIGNDVWIGAGVYILGGVRIGDGAVIGTGAVVTRDVEPYSIVGGIPAKMLKMRFTAAQIEFLKKYRWWDKDTAWLKSNYTKLNDIDSLIELEEDGGKKTDC